MNKQNDPSIIVKEVKCHDCDFKTLDEFEFEEHWYFKHGAGSYHGEVTVISEGKELFKVDENKNVIDIDENWRENLIDKR